MIKALGIGILGLCIFILCLWLKYSLKEKENLEEKLAQTEADTEKVKKQMEKYSEEKKDNEELNQKINSGNDIDSFNASLEQLQKQSDKGKHRNN